METPGLGLLEAHIYHGHKCHCLKSPPCIFYSGVKYKAGGMRGAGRRREKEGKEAEEEKKKTFYLTCAVGARTTLVYTSDIIYWYPAHRWNPLTISISVSENFTSPILCHIWEHITLYSWKFWIASQTNQLIYYIHNKYPKY